ncbi:hypothetical protein ABT346_19565 [Micromonospora peucetia]
MANGIPEATMPTARPSVPTGPATPIALVPPGTRRVRREPWR